MTALRQACIARIEAATGADRELDAWIFCAAEHPDKKPQRNFFYKNRDEWGVFVTNQPEPGLVFHDAPHYTASIDAALTLVPEGGSLHGLYQRTMPEMGGYMWSAEVWANGRRAYRAKGRTPQGAIGAAALRAVAEHLSTRGNARPITPPQSSQEQGEE